VLRLQYQAVPARLWQAPVPVVALAGDWNLLWHGYRLLARFADLVLTDAVGAELLRRDGSGQAREAVLFGGPASLLDGSSPDGPRDIDVLFVGNFQPAVQRDRLPWLARLARLSDRYHVRLATAVHGGDYRALLARSRIAFNRAIRSEWNLRAFEAVAAGCLLLQEEGNREVPRLLQEGKEFVAYNADNLEALVEHYLTHEDERRAIADAGRARAAELTAEHFWREQERLIDAQWPQIEGRSRSRPRPGDDDLLLPRTWQLLSAAEGSDPSLADDLRRALQDRPRDATLHNALGLTLARTGAELPAVATAFQDGWLADPRHVVAGLNLAEALARLGQPAEAADQAGRTLAMLDRLGRLPQQAQDDPRYPPGFDHFRIEWEKAAWQNAGDSSGEEAAKRRLLRWRLHLLRGDATGELCHFHEAALARPDLPPGRVALGGALAKAGKLREATPHLRQAVEANPFDTDAARMYADVLRGLGEAETLFYLARDRRLLHRAAPDLVPEEPWFTETPRPVPPDSTTAERTYAIAWQGAFTALHSLALVNRAVCSRLARRGHRLSLLPPRHREPPSPKLDGAAVLEAHFRETPDGPVDVFVAHQWPPDFSRPTDAPWVLMQPWEFGSIPTSWLGPLRDQVDELWVPSRFVRDCFTRAGVPEAKVHVVPNGIDLDSFATAAEPYPLQTPKRFRFLYVGGTLYRKGFDVLLHAYGRAFSGRDDVCLVVKDMGSGTFYRGQTAQALIAEHQARPGAPAVEYLGQELTAGELRGLYAACHCLAQPYRGEGFCLPAAEAMAAGLPVIVTGYGPALDFCTPETAYLLPYRLVRFAEKRAGDLETADHPWLAEPDADALRWLLRRVYADPGEAQARGRAARDFVLQHLTWDHTVAAIEARLRALVDEQPRYRLDRPEPTPVYAAALPMSRPRVSLCMIVKDEAHNLPDCLGSVADLVDEIIVIDTGSTDNTAEVAQGLGARVFSFPWVDSFAAARNESLRHATGEWVLWMDADDRLDDENRAKLRALVQSLPDEDVGFVMKCLCLPNPETGRAAAVDHVRLFRHHARLRWHYRIHEQILPALRDRGADLRWSDVVIRHVGYQDTALRQRKLQRDFRLLTLEQAESPDDPFVLFNLGMVLHEWGRYAEALPHLQASLRRSHPTDSIVRKLYALISQCHRLAGRPQEALAVCREGRGHYPLDVELLFHESVVLSEAGDATGSEACLLQLLFAREGEHFASVNPQLRAIARHNLAVLCRKQGRDGEAESHWHAALADGGDPRPCWVGLAELYLGQRRWAELENALAWLEQDGRAALDAAVLRARALLARGEYGPARVLLEGLIARQPEALLPWVILSDVLLTEGRDWEAAERALRAILALCPDHAEAKQNLAVLLRQLGRPAE
jgi:glycosyltransferase involved in cell wall biosynthesis/predicted Zn-dependent protease